MRLTIITFILSTLVMTGLVSCREPIFPGERDSAITFEQIHVDGSVLYIYESPDPCCVGKMHRIDAMADSGRLVLKCTNYDSIFIHGLETDDVILDGELECVKKGKWYRCTRGKWEVWTEGADKLVFDFHKNNITNDSEDWLWDNGLFIGATTSKGRVFTNIHVSRYLKRDS